MQKHNFEALHFNEHYEDEPTVRLRPGEDYKIWLEVDGSFDSSFYEIEWKIIQSVNDVIKKGIGKDIEFTPEIGNVSYAPEIYVFLTTKRNWHRCGTYDDVVVISLGKTLPPIEDSY